MAINVLLVDDHKMLREGIKTLLEFDNDIIVSGQSSTGKECMELLSKNKYDVVVLDINLPDCSGISLLKDIKKNNKSVKVLMLTVHNEVEYLIDSLNSGANGYILKDSDTADLVKAIKAVYRGEKYIQPDLVPILNSRLVRIEDDLDKQKDITKREKQILICIAQGKTNKDIADQFEISERTVKNHITNLFKKIDVTDRTQAAVFAIRNNLVQI